MNEFVKMKQPREMDSQVNQRLLIFLSILKVLSERKETISREKHCSCRDYKAMFTKSLFR